MVVSTEDMRVIQAQSSSVIAHFCDQLRVVEHINASVKWDPVRSEMSPGEAIKALLINLLVRREPLYRIETFYAHMDIPQLFGKAWQAEDFHDDRLGAALEKLAKGDLSRAYHAIAWDALEREGIVLDQAHVDTTSLSVQGAYEQASGDDAALRIDYGYSKDKRNDLKQILFGLGSVQGLPLFADVMAGNTSDKTWNGSFAIRMAELVPPEQLREMIVIADSAMVTEENLNLYADRPFISRLPETYSLCHELKEAAFEQEANWVSVGALTDKPGAATYRIQGMSSELYGRTYRFAVVQSSALDRRKQQKIDRDIVKERASLDKAVGEWAATEYHCETDAAKQLAEHLKIRTKYHQLQGQVERIEKIKRPRGRPAKDVVCPTETVYVCRCSAVPDEARIRRAREHESTFVLISNVKEEREKSVLGLLRRYKSQIEVENLFRALKHPYFVHGVFLKNDLRVLGLSYVLVIGLLLYALLQRRVRLQIAKSRTPLRLYGKDFYSPTGKTLLEQFESAHVISIMDPQTQKMTKIVKLSESARQILQWLGLDESVYLNREPSG
jgi:transposase